MMYKIRQRIISFGDNFTIKDENDIERFIVKGKIVSLGNKLRIYDLLDNELVYIEQEVFHLLPKYNIYLRGAHSATVKKELSFLKPRFFIESSQGNFTIDGDIFSHEFQIMKNGNIVARVSKKWFSFSDTYGAEISDTENQEFMLAMVIVIDQILYDNKK